MLEMFDVQWHIRAILHNSLVKMFFLVPSTCKFQPTGL